MLPVLALLGCFWWMASLALKNTGFDRFMFGAMAVFMAVLFFVILVS